MTFISNARMYAVSPLAEAAWRDLIGHIGRDAGVSLSYMTYPAPRPLEELWRRGDLGCVQMCGYPIALGVADVVPLASPIPAATWAGGRAVYRSDLIVRRDAPYETLADTFDGTVGWTVEHSHSGFNALRHHLLRYRSEHQHQVFRRAVGNLVAARRVLDCVLDGSIDVGPLDGYWHMLIDKFEPDLTANVRILDVTATAPMPAFVASPALPEEHVQKLRSAFVAASSMSWFEEFAKLLLIQGFEQVASETFAETMAWDRAARADGYMYPT